MKRTWKILAGVSLPVVAWFAGTHWVWSQLLPEPLAPLTPASGTTLSARSCQPCHSSIHEEWEASMMAKAMVDPIFVEDYEHQGRPFICLRCHAPLAEQQPALAYGLLSVKPLIPLSVTNDAFDAELQSEGVTCVVCHLEEGAMVGRLEDSHAPHPVRWGDPQASCARCHQLEITPLSNLERPLTDTVREWEKWKEETGREDTCVDCHMPRVARVVGVGGPVRIGHEHSWHGAWDEDMLGDALGIQAWRERGEVVVRLENLAGHHVPSGDPARAVVVRAGDEEVVLARRVPLPRLIDLGDNTLRPAEVRFIRLPYANPVQVVFEQLRFLDVEHDDPGVLLFEDFL
jgi:hypothetical protein